MIDMLKTIGVIVSVWMLLATSAEALTIQEQALARRTFAPLPAGDSRILLDATLTSAAAATSAGFTLDGTGHVFDSNGYNGKGTGTLGLVNWAGSAQMAATGTIYIQFERRAIATDEANNGGIFIDSIGHAAAGTRAVLNTSNDAATYARRIRGNTFADFQNIANATTTTIGFNRMNSHAVPTYQDQMYAEVVWTWRGPDYWIYVDGHPFYHGTSPASPTALDLDNVRVGGLGTASNTIGDYYIKRIQLSSAWMPPRMIPLRVGLLGDSFVKRAFGTGDPASDTVAAINAVQKGLSMDELTVTYGYVTGQTSWALGLESLAWTNTGGFLPIYWAGKSGGGYEKNVIPSAYTDALNAYRPELVIALASVNDVNPSSPVSNIVANTKAKLDAMIDGNTALRKIIFCVGFGGHRNPATAAVPGWLDEYKRVSALLTAGLESYRGVVQVVDVYGAWGGDNYPVTQTVGSNPLNVTATAGNDVHPSPTGLQKMAEILWPHVRDFVLMRPTR